MAPPPRPMKTETSCLLLADDLTGAVDSSAPAVRDDWRVLLATGWSELGTVAGAGADQVVVNTDSRHSAPEEAAGRVRAVLDAWSGGAPSMIYKKTDSVLRGNIAAELRALAGGWPERSLFYVPAMPEAGRTVRDGVLSVDGVPVAETAFARDPESPVSVSSVLEIVRPAFGDAVRLHPLDAIRRGDFPASFAPGCHVFDGETEEDLLRVAGRLASVPGGPLLLAGPGGFAKHLPGLAGRGGARTEVAWHAPLLVVSGSMHPRSLGQLDVARIEGAAELILAAEDADSPDFRRRAGEALGRGRRVLVHTGPRREMSAAAHAELGRCLAVAAAGVIRETGFPDCLVFGGQTATRLVHALGLRTADVLGSPFPGMGILRFPVEGEGRRDFTLTTKSGAMGPRDLVTTS